MTVQFNVLFDIWNDNLPRQPLNNSQRIALQLPDVSKNDSLEMIL